MYPSKGAERAFFDARLNSLIAASHSVEHALLLGATKPFPNSYWRGFTLK